MENVQGQRESFWGERGIRFFESAAPLHEDSRTGLDNGPTYRNLQVAISMMRVENRLILPNHDYKAPIPNNLSYKDLGLAFYFLTHLRDTGCVKHAEIA